jgi:mono/diheme cytochrome c family protein
MKKFAAGFLTGLIAMVIGTLGFLRLGLLDVTADVPVSGAVTRLLDGGIHASVWRTAPTSEHSLPRNEETLIAGGKLYLGDCVGCHGEPGEPPSRFGGTFFPPAPQFSQTGTEFTEAEIFWVAKHGIRRTGMAAQAESYSDEQLWSLAAFISRSPNWPSRVLSEIRVRK